MMSVNFDWLNPRRIISKPLKESKHMFEKVIGFIALSAIAFTASAAGVSTTEFSGTGFSDTQTIGGSVNDTAYSGFVIAKESTDDAISLRADAYIGSSSEVGKFRENTVTESDFSGTAVTNGLVGRTEQQATSFSYTDGFAKVVSSDSRDGLYAEFSAVGEISEGGGRQNPQGNSNNNGVDPIEGGEFNGIVGGEVGAYSISSYSTTKSNYGSESVADTYSVSSYGLD